MPSDVEKLLIRCHLSPGDIVMLTAAIRDLHLAYPGRFATDFQTSASELWENNPYLTSFAEGDSGVRTVEMHYPLIQHSNTRPYHFIHGYVHFLEELLQLRIPVTAFKGDVHLANHEKSWMSQVAEYGYNGPFWLMVAGGKFDFTAKWWNPEAYQQVVGHFRGRLPFVQVGESDHWHPRLRGVMNFVGKTDTRQFVRLMYHADGVVCPVTFAMHLAAAVETRPGLPQNRACVVIAGGREPAQWEAYPHHQYINTNGALYCCDNGGCWKSRCQPVNDGDSKDHDLCCFPVNLTPDLRIPKCMDMIRADDVIRRIELYVEGGALRFVDGREWDMFEAAVERSKVGSDESSMNNIVMPAATSAS